MSGEGDVLGRVGEVEAKIVDVVAAKVFRRLGGFLRRFIIVVNGDLVGKKVGIVGILIDLMGGVAREIVVGLVGTQIGFNDG